MFFIEKNIALPRGKIVPEELGRPPIYPFADMEVGDSILGPTEMRTAAYAWAKRNAPDWKMVTRSVGAFNVRVWRAA